MDKIYLSDIIRNYDFTRFEKPIEFIGLSMYDIDDISGICGVDLSNIGRTFSNIRDPETGDQYDCGVTIKLGKPIGSEDDTESADTKSVKTNTEEPGNNIVGNYVTVMSKKAAANVAYRMIGRTDQIIFTVGLGYSDSKGEGRSSNLISYNVFVQKRGVGYRIQKKKHDQETTYTIYESDANAVNGRRRIANYNGRRLEFPGIAAKMRMFLEKPQTYLESAKIEAMHDIERKNARNRIMRGAKKGKR